MEGNEEQTFILYIKSFKNIMKLYISVNIINNIFYQNHYSLLQITKIKEKQVITFKKYGNRHKF